MKDKLAIHGGSPVLSTPLAPYPSLGEEEVAAVTDVVRSGCLSAFYGSWGDQFLGGPQVKSLESEWAHAFSVRHAISMNSATSGLYAAMGAIGISPGDEVIVPPTTMSATAMAPLMYGGIPVFADIEQETFCLDPAAVEAALTSKTKAIIAVNLFGHPARLAELRRLADERGIHLVEDNAQGPLAKENGRYAGTIGHIGVFSLNYHKHIHAGEGGVCVTDDDELARRLQLIRNHAENIVEALGMEDITNMVGHNYRLTEMGAAVARVQLAHSKEHVRRRVAVARRLSEAVRGLEGLHAPLERAGCESVYYLWSLRVVEKELGVSRDVFSRALAAEGFPHFNGYVRPLYLLPVFQRRHALGRSGYPFTLTSRTYSAGLCPTAERLHRDELLCFETCMYASDDKTAELLAAAIQKVHAARASLRP